MNNYIIIIFSTLTLFLSSTVLAMGKLDKPERKNYSGILEASNNIYPLLKKIPEKQTEIKNLKEALRNQRAENLWLDHEITIIKSQPLDSFPHAFLAKKEQIKNYPPAKRLELLSSLDSSVTCRLDQSDNVETCFQMLFEKIFNKRIDQNEPTAITNKQSIEFLLTSIINYDLIPAWRAILSDKGMETLSQLRYVDYALHNNGKSLVEFLDTNYPITMLCNRQDIGKEFLIRACAQTFDAHINKSSKSNNFYNPYPYQYQYINRVSEWTYDFSFDSSDSNPNSFNTILKNLQSNPENFKERVIPRNFTLTLEALLNKEKQYFSFLIPQIIRERHSRNYIMLMAQILLNSRDPDLQEKSYEDRQKIAANFLQNCINNSKRCSLKGEGKQDLRGKMFWVHGDCPFSNGYGPPCNEGRCIYRKTDFCNKPEQLIYQFLLSLSPYHKTAEHLLDWLYCAHELRDYFVHNNRYIFFRFFRETKNTEFAFLKKNIASFIKNHPELIEENTLSEGEKSKAQADNSIDNIAFLFENAANYLETFCNLNSFMKLYTDNLFQIKIKVTRLEEADEEQDKSSKKLSPSIEDLSHQTH